MKSLWRWLCVQRSAEPTDNAVTGPALPAMYHSVSPADLPRTTEPLSPLPPAHEGQAVFSSYMKMSHAFYENHAFYISLFCVTLRPSQRAFGTYLCVYRKEDDHTAPDRKSSGWMILSAMWLRRTMFPSRRVGRGRQILSFPSSCRPGQKVRRCEWSRSDALFVCTLLHILLSVCR